MIKYPKHVKVSIEDFRSTSWKYIVKSSKNKNYLGFHRAFSKAARKAFDKKDLKKCKIFWLFSDVCSMMLNPSSPNEPFTPSTIFDGRRSAIPEDFNNDDIELFAQIAIEINNKLLQARFADFVWLLIHPRDPKYALLAIDAYRKINITENTWFSDGRGCIERAIYLSFILGALAEKRLKHIEHKLMNVLNKSIYESGFLSLGIAEVMLKYHFGKSNSDKIASKLEEIANCFDKEGNYHHSRKYFDVSSCWYKAAENNNKFVEMNISAAESWIKDADARLSSNQPSNMVANNFIENAIQKYRSIPKIDRVERHIDARISELYSRLNETGKKSISEMGRISSPKIDITKMVEQARENVKGKKPLDALLQFANIHRGEQVNNIRKTAEKILRQNPLQAFISATHMSHDGRVIAKRPGLKFNSKNNDANDEVIWAEMVQNYQLGIGLAVQGLIIPALEVMLLEHRIKESDFIEIARSSPIVPKDRCVLIGKGLFSGYDRDFISAIHILIPQFENIIRWHLKLSRIKTTTLDARGIENEIGLSALMEIPQVKDLFDEDLEFEIKALFCDPFGPNLRNEIAHGLLNYEQSKSVYVVYAWWLFLKIVFNTFWNTYYAPKSEGEK